MEFPAYSSQVEQVRDALLRAGLCASGGISGFAHRVGPRTRGLNARLPGACLAGGHFALHRFHQPDMDLSGISCGCIPLYTLMVF